MVPSEWIDLPMIPRIIGTFYIGADTANAGETVRAFSYIVEDPGSYFVTLAITTSPLSDTIAKEHKSSVYRSYIYGDEFDTGPLTFSRRFNKGDEIFLDLKGHNGGKNVLYQAYVTIIRIGV
jgi:hypothetical protein